MKPEDFLIGYTPNRVNEISSTHLINVIGKETDNYIEIDLRGNFKLNHNFIRWSNEEFNKIIEDIGMMFSEVFIHTAEVSKFSSLDEFMYYIRFVEKSNLIPENLIKYPFKKGERLTDNDFKNSFTVIFGEEFMNNNKIIIDLNYKEYTEGFYYFNTYSIKVLGATFSNYFWAFSYHPYI